MTVPPVAAMLVRSFREEARAGTTYVWRFALVACLMLTLVASISFSAFVGDSGLRMFQQITWLNLLFVTLAACTVYATPITEEKQEGTLGLLRMTRLSPVAILLGKSTSRLLSGVALIVAQVPFTLLAITLGGVSLEQVSAAYLCILSYMVFVANLGLLFSVVSRSSRVAGTLVAVTLASLILFPDVINAVIAASARARFGAPQSALLESAGTLAGWLSDASPWQSWSILLSGVPASAFTFQVKANAAASVILFGVAWWAFGPFNREDVPPKGFLSRWIDLGRRRRTLSPWSSPLAWKDFHFVMGGPRALLYKTLLYVSGSVLYSFVTLAVGSRARDAVNGLLSIATLALILELALIASRFLAHEVRARTLPCLVQLPGSTDGIVLEKLLGCTLSLVPCLAFLGIAAIPNAELLSELFREIVREPVVGYCFISVGGFFYHLVAWLSLYLRWGAIAAAAGITWISIMLFAMLVALTGYSRVADPEALVAVGATVALGLAVILNRRIIRRIHDLAAR